jgi:hypothetical protein
MGYACYPRSTEDYARLQTHSFGLFMKVDWINEVRIAAMGHLNSSNQQTMPQSEVSDPVS